MKKLLVLGIIALFIGLAFIPSFNAISISKTDDTTPPEVKLVWDIEEGIVRFTAICSDDTGIDYVIFTWNGMIVAGSYEEPYEWIIDLETVNKQHICAVASDFAGNSASDCVDFRSRKLDIESTNDCIECQSNGKTHLAEKLLNKLEKNEVLPNVIKSDNQKEDTPICELLYARVLYFEDMVYYYSMLAYNYQHNPILYMIYCSICGMYMSRMGFVIITAVNLDCDWIDLYPPR